MGRFDLIEVMITWAGLTIEVITWAGDLIEVITWAGLT